MLRLICLFLGHRWRRLSTTSTVCGTFVQRRCSLCGKTKRDELPPTCAHLDPDVTPTQTIELNTGRGSDIYRRNRENSDGQQPPIMRY